MKKGMILVVFLMLLPLLPMVAASVSISSPKTLYNNGDSLDLTVSLMSQNTINDFLSGNVECNGNSFQVYKSVIALKAGESKDIGISVPLDPTLFGNMSGNCVFSATYNGEQRNSQNFEITSVVEIDLKQNSSNYNPGESILFSGTATKKNGQNLEGYLNLTLDGTNQTLQAFVINGSFEVSMNLPSDIPARTYNAIAYVYEQNSAGVPINSGQISKQIKVNQVVRSVEFAFGSVNASLGDSLVFTPIVYDQAREKATREVSVELFDSSGEKLNEFVSNSDSTSNFTINQSFSPGEYSLRTNVEGISGEGSFAVSEMSKLNYSIVNGSLFVKNIGNVVYSKLLEIFIGEDKQQVQVDLKVGEEKEYVLNAPKGYYAVAVNEGNQINALGTAFLTGNAISVKEYGQLIKGRVYSIIIWFIVIICAIGAGVYYYRKIRNKPYSAKTPLNVVSPAKTMRTMAMPVSSVKERRETVIEQGEKQEASVVVLKIKNIDEIRASASNALESIESVVTAMKLLRAKVQEDNGAWTIAFLSGITGEKDNNLRAIKAAQRIERDLQEHNRRYSQKIKFGIGVHDGELIVETSPGKSNFTSSGTTLLQAKRIADRSNGQALISEAVRKKTLSSVKVEKVGDDSYKVTRIVEGNNSPFLERFKQRTLEGQ